MTVFKTIIVNLFAGPGAGKSTIAANVFAELKWAEIDVELVTEYAKELVWEERFKALENQFYIFGKQLERIRRLTGNVDVVITDSPIVLSPIYKLEHLSEHFDLAVLEEFKRFNNVNYFIERRKRYIPKGRMQTEDQAKEKDKEIETFLISNGIYFTNVMGDVSGVETVVSDVLTILKGRR